MSQQRDAVSNAVKEKLQRGEVVASITVRLVPTVEVVRIAKTAGFDSLYIDLEHSSFSMETTSQLCIMALEAEVPAFVRVPANTPEYISRVLDGGALGVIAPGVSSAKEARAVVAAANAATMVIVQFESAASLAAMDEIVAVDGVDMVMIGTNDLMADLGIPGEFDHPK